MLRGLLSSTLRRDKGSKKSAVSGPDPEEVERGRDIEWLNSCEKGKVLKELWEHIPSIKGPSIQSPTVTNAASPKQLPSLDWDIDNDAEDTFRSQFLQSYENWTPTPGDSVIPSIFLSHFCVSLHSLVDALAKVDTSMPRGRAPYQYLAVSKTLSCLMIAIRGPLNIRYIVEKGLLVDISKLIEAIVTGLWPLTLPLACLKESVRNSEELAKSKDHKAGANQDLVRLRDKLSQIQLRISVLSQAVKLVFGCVVQRDQTSISGQSLEGITSLRIPLTDSETAAACQNGQPSVVKVLSWSVIMLNTYVLHAVTNSDLKQNDDKKDNAEDSSSDVLFDIISMMLSTIETTSLLTTSSIIVDAGIPQALCSCLKWPPECIYQNKDTGQPISEDCRHEVLKSDYLTFKLPPLNSRRRDQFSETHQHAIRIATQILDKYPVTVTSFIDFSTGSEANLLDVVSESMAWHVCYYTSKSGDDQINDQLSESFQAQLVEPNDEFLVDFFKAEVEKSNRSPNGVQSHHNIADPNLLSQLGGVVASSIVSDGKNLFETVVEKADKNLINIFDLVTDLSKTSNSIRSLAYADAVSKIANDVKSSHQTSLWSLADIIEMISLNVFAPLFLNSPKGPLMQRAHPPPANLIVALNHQRDRYYLQLYCLSCLLLSVKAQEEQDNSRTKRDALISKITDSGIAGYRVSGANGQLVSVYEVMVQLGVHRTLLESEVFYQSAFDTMRGKTVRDPLRYRWEPPDSDEKHSKSFRMLIKQTSRLVLSKVATHKTRDIKVDVVAVSDMLKQCRYQSKIVIEMGLLLLQMSRQREPTTGRLKIAPVAETDGHVVNTLLTVLTQAFEAQHEMVIGLQAPAPIQSEPTTPSQPSFPRSVTEDVPAIDDDDDSISVNRSVSLNLIGKPACPTIPPPALKRKSHAKSFCAAPLETGLVLNSPKIETPISPLKKLFSSPAFGSLDKKVKRGASSIVIVGSPAGPSPQQVATAASPLSIVSVSSDIVAPGPIPASVTMSDLPYFMIARNVVLNIIETLLELPSVQITMLNTYQTFPTLLSCLNHPSLRDFGKKQISFLLKQAGEGSEPEILSKILKPPFAKLLFGLIGPSATPSIVTTSLELIQEVISSLEAEDRLQLTTLRSRHTSKLPEAGKRRKVLQNINRECYVNLIHSMHCTAQHGDEKVVTSHELAMSVIDTVGWLLRGNARAKEQFRSDIGWDHFSDAILQCVDDRPEQVLFDHLFAILLDIPSDGDIDSLQLHCIKNEDVLILILKLCFHSSFSENLPLLLNLTKRVKTILSSSVHNLEKASRVDTLETLVDMLVKWDNRDIRAQVVECYHRVGRHSLTVRQLKPLFSILRSQTGPRRTFLLPWVIRILRNLGSIQSPDTKREKEDRRNSEGNSPTPRGPSSFFDFSADLNSGLKLPDAANFPSSTGYTISMWLRIESFHPPSLQTTVDYTPVLYALYSESPDKEINSFSAFFVDGRLRLSVNTSGESDAIADVNTFQFKTNKWYHVLISHSCGKRIIGKSEAKVFINGSEVWKGSLRYPRMQQQYPYTVTVATDIRGLRQETLLTSLYGQISCIYLIDGLVTNSVVGAIYGLGSDYQSNFAPADREKVVSILGSESIKALFHEFLSSKIYMLFNPLASQDGMLINVATLNQMDEIHETSTNKDSLAVLLRGSQLCITQSLYQVLDSLGGLSALIPLLALLGEYRHGLFSDEDRSDSKKDVQLSTVIVPYLISNLLSLLYDLLRLQHLFVFELQNQRLIHILNMLLRPLGPFLDKSNVERVKIVISKIWNEDTWRDAVMYLLLDLSIWIQATHSVQMDLFATVYKVVSNDPKLIKNTIGLMYFVDQMTWHLYYETPTVGMEGVRDRDLRERMKDRRGTSTNREIYQVRQEAFRVIQLLMTECPSSDDMQLLNHALLNPVQDRRQLCDVLDFLLDFWEQKPDSVDQFLKHGGETVLVTLVGSDFPPLRQATIRCIGQLLKSKKIREKYETAKPHGLFVIQHGLNDKLLDMQTYKALRDLLLGQIHTPAGGSQAVSDSPCRPLPVGGNKKYPIDAPATMNLILKQLVRCQPADRNVVIRDLITITSNNIENCKIISSLSIITLLLDVYAAVMTDEDDESSATSNLLIEFLSSYLYQLLLCSSDGWKHLDILISASDNYVSFDVLGMLLSVFSSIISLFQNGKITNPNQLIQTNVCYTIVFIEDLLCFHNTVSSAVKAIQEDDSKLEQSGSESGSASPQSPALPQAAKVYSESSELNIEDTTKWLGWDLAFQSLELMRVMGLYKVYEFCKAVDNKESKFFF
eukprot:TRINITY_DN2428_c0_g1_i2.p1 TRINITY_DN2428_c0_g1~~TRINITY_DN2428_c0_g1_i2.p1  ORF type:complete len:2296 (+),score=456.99 TRINITY_DN2428_c0_g1_i2:114-7001(+)